MLFSSIYQSILAQFSRRKLPDNGLYTKYIKKFWPMPAQFSFGKWNTEILQINRYSYLIERFRISNVISI